MRQTAADRQLLVSDSRDLDADRCMFEKVKFIGDFPMFVPRIGDIYFTNPRPDARKIVADPRQNRTTAVC